jgi:cytosine/adenosine deaminase-related metal-dependent hydrolase
VSPHQLSTINHQLILRSRIVLPIRRQAIADGAVVVSGHLIRAVGRWEQIRKEYSAPIIDLGDSALLPGLINAHCHLEYTDLAGEFLPPRHFSDWLKLIVAAKGLRTNDDFAAAWQHGAQMLLRTGTTTVADIAALPEILPQSTLLRILSFLEMTGVKSKQPPAKIITTAAAKIKSLRTKGLRAGLSPHSPYSTTAELLSRTARTARQNRWRVTTHVAESPEEFEMFTAARGRMFDWLHKQRDCSDCGCGSPVQHLARAGLLGANFLAVHANCLAPGDAHLLARKKSSVVHCPRSHSFFGHPKFPFKELAAAGVNLCLGTDSLASIETKQKQEPELNMFSELRSFVRKNRDTPPGTVLRMATLNSAQALGLAGRIGEISAGAWADLITIPCREKLADVQEAVLHHRGEVTASLIGGKWAIAPK